MMGHAAEPVDLLSYSVQLIPVHFMGKLEPIVGFKSAPLVVQEPDIL